MAKTKLTLQLEKNIWEATHKQGVFCCFEVTIGWYGKERVDYMTYDTNGIFRCYEIKVSKTDFYSKSHHTFLGNFNYYVMTQELYNEVKNEIPQHIGVYIGDSCIKRAKKQPLGIDAQILKDSFIRSLSREAEKVIKSDNPTIVEKLKRQIRQAESMAISFLTFLVSITIAILISNTFISGVIGVLVGLCLRIFLEVYYRNSLPNSFRKRRP